MNQITGAYQSTGSIPLQNLPPERFGELGRLGDALAPAIPGQTRAQWLEQARTTADPVLRAYYNELVTLAGGRTDDAALNQVIDLFQKLDAAETPRDIGIAQRDLLDQIGTMLSRFDPLNNLLNAVQPQLAGLTRAAGLGETAWGTALQKVLDTPGSAAAFNDGLRAGILAGGKDMIVSTATMVGGLVRHQADTSVLGHGGDWLRSQTGPLPGTLDAMTPSAARGAATSEAVAMMGGKIGTYLGAVADDPARLKTDIAIVINAQWSRLEASHAAAAARGPQEEARWWGETVGRVSFEVAATFVPVAGQAGKVGTVARVADGVGDAARVADTVGDLARVTGRVDDLTDAARGADALGEGPRAAGAAQDAARGAGKPADAPEIPNPRRDVVDGRRQHYFDEAGTKGDWNGALNKKLEANADYHVNGYKFSTDDKGRVSSVSGELTLAKAERNGYQQSVAGRADRLPDDQGGHLIASIFNGPGEAVNLKAMNGSFNMKEFRNLERTLADALEAGKKVEVKIDIIHSGDSLRPEAFSIEYVINGKAERTFLENKAGG